MSPNQEFLFHSLFACVATMAFAASFYLLLRRQNAYAVDVNPPLRLRRWTAAFFAASGFSHLWWLFICYSPMSVNNPDGFLICMLLDTVLTVPVLLCTMLVMLQDRKRPLWPIFVASALSFIYLLIINILDVKGTAYLALPALLIFIFFIVLVRAVRQYHRWLLENYADLEHKEAWTTMGVLAAFVLIAVSYGFANDYFFFEVFIELANILLITILLWRVETMQTLEHPVDEVQDITDSDPHFTKLQSLLQLHCVDGQYYLRYDASLTQLADILDTNTHYLSQHFKQQGLTYNTYINSLRIRHFISLYQEAIQSQVVVTASELATKCGFRNYNTFSSAFKQLTGQTVTDWMIDQNSKFNR